jgi:hypothetical protein
MKLVAFLILSVITITYAAPNCTYYCTAIMANCNGANLQYTDMNHCMAMCGAFPVGTDSDQTNNTLGCRVYHADASATLGLQHCFHAGPSGVDLATGSGICGTQCEAYCSIMTYSMGCNTTIRAFNSPAECMAVCPLFPSDATKYFDNTTGNTLQCRIYHAKAAFSLGLMAHCAHAAPLGGGQCGNVTDNYCDIITYLCKGADAQYPDAAYCKKLAPSLPPSTTNYYDYDGDSIACRAYHSVVGGAAPSHCSHGGASGNGTGGCGTSVCAAYCALSAKLCPTNYATTADCTTACSPWATSKLGAVADVSGDTFYCRLYHLGAAASDAALHCPHALGNSSTCTGGSSPTPTPTPTPGPTPNPTPEDPWNTGATAGNSPVGESEWSPEPVPE